MPEILLSAGNTAGNRVGVCKGKGEKLCHLIFAKGQTSPRALQAFFPIICKAGGTLFLFLRFNFPAVKSRDFPHHFFVF